MALSNVDVGGMVAGLAGDISSDLLRLIGSFVRNRVQALEHRFAKSLPDECREAVVTGISTGVDVWVDGFAALGAAMEQGPIGFLFAGPAAEERRHQYAHEAEDALKPMLAEHPISFSQFTTLLQHIGHGTNNAEANLLMVDVARNAADGFLELMPHTYGFSESDAPDSEVAAWEGAIDDWLPPFERAYFQVDVDDVLESIDATAISAALADMDPQPTFAEVKEAVKRSAPGGLKEIAYTEIAVRIYADADLNPYRDKDDADAKLAATEEYQAIVDQIRADESLGVLCEIGVFARYFQTELGTCLRGTRDYDQELEICIMMYTDAGVAVDAGAAVEMSEGLEDAVDEAVDSDDFMRLYDAARSDNRGDMSDEDIAKAVLKALGIGALAFGGVKGVQALVRRIGERGQSSGMDRRLSAVSDAVADVCSELQGLPVDATDAPEYGSFMSSASSMSAASEQMSSSASSMAAKDLYASCVVPISSYAQDMAEVADYAREQTRASLGKSEAKAVSRASDAVAKVAKACRKAESKLS